MSPSQLVSLMVALSLGAPAARAAVPVCHAPPSPASQRARRVGEDVPQRFETAPPYAHALALEGGLVHTDTLHHPGASYIAAHFERLELEDGDFVVVRSPDGTRSRRYDASPPGASDGFWAMHIPGDTAVVELHRSASPAHLGRHGYSIDRFARGDSNAELPQAVGSNEAVCGADDTDWAPCVGATQPALYARARSVARLLINGTTACTGWLVGSQGHVLTNQHCIASAQDAANTDFEFMAEGSGCAASCASWMGCPGHVISGATLVQVDAPRDYALVKLPVNPTASFGYLQLRASGAVVDERIYVPQHPAGYGKKIAVRSTASADASGYAEVFSLNEPSCQSGGPNDVGYFADTQGGSSGAPVIAYADHLVVALHHCADCPNRGVPIQSVISHLGANLPPCALPAAGCPNPTGSGEPPPNPAPNAFVFNATNTNSAQQNTTNKKLVLGAGQSLAVGTCGLTGAKVTGDTFLRLVNPAGVPVASNDDACGGRGSSLVFTAPSTGEYEVRAGCYSNATCGGTVVWQLTGGQQPPTPAHGTFAFSVVNTNFAQQATANRELTLSAGQVLTVGTCGVDGASFTGDTYVRLFSGGLEVAFNDDACSGRGSSITYSAPASGSVQVRIGCYGNTACSGNAAWTIQ
ncbi:serine protease [Myxococcus sp. K15C18031901]|uniref:trypsin-like serine peptidase n=1 Tax=Myxococcus dinghuensis TaxID=2906761 RepID=UPI0020A7FB51|nr:serine protease [Myxococcus dinghuensis]MCP3101360.1 serine protease [Myxococcus dinghuensis]